MYDFVAVSEKIAGNLQLSLIAGVGVAEDNVNSPNLSESCYKMNFIFLLQICLNRPEQALILAANCRRSLNLFNISCLL